MFSEKSFRYWTIGFRIITRSFPFFEALGSRITGYPECGFGGVTGYGATSNRPMNLNSLRLLGANNKMANNKLIVVRRGLISYPELKMYPGKRL